MNIEIILWIVSFFIVWEIFYIFTIKKIVDGEDWVFGKIQSGLAAVIFMIIQVAVVSGIAIPFENMNYFNLIYEIIIISALVLFFYLNKQVAKYL